MKSLFRTVLAAFLLLMPLLSLHAGPEHPWERLLDRYELICKKCLELKNLRDAGEDVPAAQMNDLLSELESLRSQLKGISDKMPAGVRRRFDTIRQMYASGVITDTRIEELPQEDAVFTVSNPLPLPSPAGLQRLSPAVSSPPLLPPRWTVSATAVVFPDFAWGGMVSCVWKKVGGYVAFRSNYTYHVTGYDALSDGSSDGSRIWTSGKAASDLLLITAGPVLPVNGWFSVFGGAGYGYRRLCWEDTDGQWMRVVDASPSGLCTELGVSFSISRFSASVNWLAIPAAYGGAAVSLGFIF